MECFLPSEIGRLVLGYLQEEGCPTSYKTFLNECVHLREYSVWLRQGRQYPTTIAGKTLKEMLNEYGRARLIEVQLKSDSVDGLWLKHDAIIEQLRSRCLPANVSSTSSYGYVQQQISRSRRGKVNTREEISKFGKPVRSPPVSDPAPITKYTVASSRNGDSDDRVNARSSDSEDSDAGLVMETQSQKSSLPSTPVKASVKTLSPQIMGGHIKNVLSDQKETIEPVSGIRKIYRWTQHMTDSQSKSKITDKSSASRTKANVHRLTNYQRRKEADKVDSDPTVTSQSALVTTVGTTGHAYNTRKQARMSNCVQGVAGKGNEDTQSQGEKIPDTDGMIPETPQKLGFEPELYTPMKEDTSVGIPAPLGRSPRRKRPVPKRHSSGIDLPAVPQLPPVTMPTSGGTSNNSNSSADDLLNMPLLDDLIKNVQFVEKMAETINKAKMGAEPAKCQSRPELVNKGSQRKGGPDPGLSTPEITRPCSPVLNKPSQSTTADEGNSNDISSVLHIQDNGITDEAIKGIIEMTKSDPCFDALFQMFQLDKNEFIEKEYGKQPTDECTTQSQEIAETSESGACMSPQVLRVMKVASETPGDGTTAQVIHPMAADGSQLIETIKVLGAKPASSRSRAKKNEENNKEEMVQKKAKKETKNSGGRTKTPVDSKKSKQSAKRKKQNGKGDAGGSGMSRKSQALGSTVDTDMLHALCSSTPLEVKKKSRGGFRRTVIANLDIPAKKSKPDKSLQDDSSFKGQDSVVHSGNLSELSVNKGDLVIPVGGSGPAVSQQGQVIGTLADLPLFMGVQNLNSDQLPGGMTLVIGQSSQEVQISQAPVTITYADSSFGVTNQFDKCAPFTTALTQAQVQQMVLPQQQLDLPQLQQPCQPQLQQPGPQLQQPCQPQLQQPGPPQLQQPGPQLQQPCQPQLQQPGQPQLQQPGPQLQQPGPPQLQHHDQPQLQQPGPQLQQPGPPQVQHRDQPQLQQPCQPQLQQPGPPQLQQPGPPQLQQPGQPQLQQPGPPQLQQPGPPQLQHRDQPQLQQPGPPQLQHRDQPQLQQPGPPQLQHRDQPQLQQPSPPQLQHRDQPQLQQPGPPQLQQPGPPQLQQPGPPQLQQPGPPQLQHLDPPEQPQELVHQQQQLQQLQQPQLHFLEQQQSQVERQWEGGEAGHDHRNCESGQALESLVVTCGQPTRLQSGDSCVLKPVPTEEGNRTPCTSNFEVVSDLGISTDSNVQMNTASHEESSIENIGDKSMTAISETSAIIYSNPETPTLGAAEVVHFCSPVAVSPYSDMMQRTCDPDQTPRSSREVEETGSARTRRHWPKRKVWTGACKKRRVESPLSKSSVTNQNEVQKTVVKVTGEKCTRGSVVSPESTPAQDYGNGTPLRVKEAEAAETMMALATTPVKERPEWSLAECSQNSDTPHSSEPPSEATGLTNSNRGMPMPIPRTPGKSMLRRVKPVSPVRSSVLNKLVQGSVSTLRQGVHHQPSTFISDKLENNGCGQTALTGQNGAQHASCTSKPSSVSSGVSEKIVNTPELEREAIQTMDTLRNRASHQAKKNTKQKVSKKSKGRKGVTEYRLDNTLDLDKFLLKVHSVKR